ncbi:MAG TPA: GGDEF domain-containing protein [Gammaproteobacteria bacterium]
MNFLTGIPNRRCILDILNTHWSTSGRSRQALSCLMIDVDYFKVINDSFGHDVGDQVLQIIARLIRDNLREGDSVGRIGGEEFLVVAPLPDREAAMQLCERLRSAVSQHDFGARSSTGHMTISTGIATREPDTAVPYDLVTRADAGLLEAKTSGRDRCRYARAAEKRWARGVCFDSCLNIGPTSKCTPSESRPVFLQVFESSSTGTPFSHSMAT